MLISSLKGYALYLLKISAEHMKEASNKNTALIENPKFWSYLKHKNPGIRAAWFEAISALLQSTIDLTKFEKQLAVAALHNIDEAETIVLPHIWTAVLLIMQRISEWYASEFHFCHLLVDFIIAFSYIPGQIMSIWRRLSCQNSIKY